MICRYDYLRQYPTVFLKMTGLRLNEFADLLEAQHSTRTACHAFATGQALTVMNGFLLPDVQPHIYSDRTVV